MMKQLLTFLFLAIATLVFTGCGDDDIQFENCVELGCPDGFSCENGVCVQDVVDLCEGITCPEGQVCINGECSGAITVSGELETTTWTKDRQYILDGRVVVPSGMTLTIEPGTVIKANSGTGTNASALIVARGGVLKAQGTADEPIVFTSVADGISLSSEAGTLNEEQNGLWGGIIILGYAPISSKDGGDEAQIEGIPADLEYGKYGGNNSEDNSGILNYVSIRHGGALIGDNNEINGLTLGGVGSGTTINQIEVVANQDDGIECFGGTVNLTNTIVWAQGDDAYDVDQSYSGTIDNFVYIAGGDSDHGLEIDGPEAAVNSDGKFTLINGTLKGLASEYADFRDGAQGNVLNNYWFNFPADADIELDDDATSVNYFSDDLVISGNQINVSHITEATVTMETIAQDKADAGNPSDFSSQIASENTITENPTVGANTSVFGWTKTAQAGVLNF